MSTSAGEITTTTTYTLIFSPEDDGYATTIGIFAAKRDHFVYCSNLHGALGFETEAIKLLTVGSTHSDPLYITVFPRGTGSIYAKCTSSSGTIAFFIAGRYLL